MIIIHSADSLTQAVKYLVIVIVIIPCCSDVGSLGDKKQANVHQNKNLRIRNTSPTPRITLVFTPIFCTNMYIFKSV